jgi:hypothetical protein
MKNMSPKGKNIHFVIVGKSCTFLEFMCVDVGVVFLHNSCKPLKKINIHPLIANYLLEYKKTMHS